MRTVKNTSIYPISLHSGPTLAPGEFGDTINADPAIEAGLVTVVEGSDSTDDDPAAVDNDADQIADAPEGIDATAAQTRRSTRPKEVK